MKGRLWAGVVQQRARTAFAVAIPFEAAGGAGFTAELAWWVLPILHGKMAATQSY